MITITIAISPNTTVTLPDSDALSKLVSDVILLSVDNQSGESISLESTGVPTAFSVDTLPLSIADGISDDIELSVVGAGDIEFVFEEEEETLSVTLLEEEEEECVVPYFLEESSNGNGIGCTYSCRSNNSNFTAKWKFVKGAWLAAITVCGGSKEVVNAIKNS